MSRGKIIAITLLAVAAAAGAILAVRGRKAKQGSPSASIQSIPANTVVRTDSGFDPQSLTVNQGERVTFQNNGSDDMRAASDPHPIHNGYPAAGGCISSTFDSCMNIAPGNSWSFKFDIAGSWGYHNHLNPSQRGTIVVNAASASSSETPPPAAAPRPAPSAASGPAPKTPPPAPAPAPSPPQAPYAAPPAPTPVPLSAPPPAPPPSQYNY